MLATTSRLENSVRGEDRLGLRVDDDRLIVVVAAGAGETGAGAAAAQAVCDAVLALPPGQESWENVFFAVDRLLVCSTAGGLAAAVVVEIVDGVIRGVSVGDASAWLVEQFQVTDLTVNQRRKPLLGSGDADPIAFGPMPFRGRLLVASNGLVSYARRVELQCRAVVGSLDQSATALVEAVRLGSGRFQDDVAVVLAEELGGGRAQDLK
jgi:PPM family protein phosphatase